MQHSTLAWTTWPVIRWDDPGVQTGRFTKSNLFMWKNSRSLHTMVSLPPPLSLTHSHTKTSSPASLTTSDLVSKLGVKHLDAWRQLYWSSLSHFLATWHPAGGSLESPMIINTNCHPLTTNPLLSLFIWDKETHKGVEDQRRFLQIKGSCSVLRTYNCLWSRWIPTSEIQTKWLIKGSDDDFKFKKCWNQNGSK